MYLNWTKEDIRPVLLVDESSIDGTHSENGHRIAQWASENHIGTHLTEGVR